MPLPALVSEQKVGGCHLPNTAAVLCWRRAPLIALFPSPSVPLRINCRSGCTGKGGEGWPVPSWGVPLQRTQGNQVMGCHPQQRSPQGLEGGLPVVVPEPHWQLRSAWCQVRNLPLPGESLPGHFIVFLRTARSLITFPHLLQMLCIPAMLRRGAEPYSISPKRTHFSPPRQLSAPCMQSKGKGAALLPRMSPQS